MKTLLFAVLLSFSFSVHAGNPEVHAIYGKILDERNLEGLTGASIRIVELNQTSYASFDGSFEIGNIPDGVYTLEIKCVSYEGMVFQSIEVKSGKIYKKIYLKPV